MIPPPLIDFGGNDSNDEEDSTSASVLSKRNATPAALAQLKKMDFIIQGDDSPRTRTTIGKLVHDSNRNLPVEYDDDSNSQSHSIISSVDDVTVEKVSYSSSANIDFLEDF